MFPFTNNWRVLAFLSLIVASLCAGLAIPGFYAWTDSDQSRPSHLLWQVPLIFCGAAIIFSCLLPWLPIKPDSTDKTSLHWRFSMRALLGLTACVAVGIALLSVYPVVTSAVLSAAAFLNAIQIAVRQPAMRLPTVALLASMLLPFAWIIGYGERGRILPSLIGLAGCLPTLLPTAALSALFDQNFNQMYWLAMLLTAAELTIGIWLARLGPKRTIAYSLLAFATSFFGSLAFYQLCIA